MVRFWPNGLARIKRTPELGPNVREWPLAAGRVLLDLRSLVTAFGESSHCLLRVSPN